MEARLGSWLARKELRYPLLDLLDRRGPRAGGEHAANQADDGASYGCGRAWQRVGEILRRPRARGICASVKDYAAGVATGGKRK
jgi:hypothetical protein